MNGYTTVGDPITGPRDTYENAYDSSASLSWIRGRHELKFGGGYQHLNVNALQGIATNGFFVFDPGFPIAGDGFAAFLFGQPVVFLQGRGDFARGIRGNGLNGYGQDTYQVTSRLTLNFGLRYELPFPYAESTIDDTLDYRPPVGGHAERSRRMLYPGIRCPRGFNSNVQKSLCSALRSCV